MSEQESPQTERRPATDRQAGTLLGVRIGGWSPEELSAWVKRLLEVRPAQPAVFACANPHSLVVADDDIEFKRALQRSAVVVADGAGLRLGACLAGQQVGPRITGSDFFVWTMECLNSNGGHAYFFGSSNEVLAVLSAKLARDFPRVRVTTWSPPFRDWDESENDVMIDAIRWSDAQVLWVGMTAPKQEKWAIRNASRLNVPLIGCVGAVFEYYAETVVRAPSLWRKFGLEWLYRLARNPCRLWRRTMVSAPIFLWRCAKQRFS